MTKAGTGTMRRVAAGITLAMTIALMGFGETVENVRGSQRPNSNIVDIYYDLDAVDGWSYTVNVRISGRTNAVSATTFSGDVGKGIAPGKNRHIVWEAGADWRGNKGDVKAVVTAAIEVPKGKPKKVQLWEGGPYWADRNIGADNPWEAGLYFWWGDTTGHRPGYNFNSDNSAIYTYGKSAAELQSSGWVTNGGVLAPSHDAAHVKWGGAWRMPTYQELSDLCSKCDWTVTTMNGMKGCVVRGRGSYASRSIFLPSAGYCKKTSRYFFSNSRDDGYYWSSVPSSSTWGWDINNSKGLDIGYYPSTFELTSIGGRYIGFSIRPVQ